MKMCMHIEVELSGRWNEIDNDDDNHNDDTTRDVALVVMPDFHSYSCTFHSFSCA